MINKLRFLSLLAVSGLLFAGSSAFAQSIVSSKHDFTTGGSAQGSTGNTDEVCVFCHTPHGADTTAPVPLWNKVLNSNQGRFTRYSTLATPSFDSLEAPVGSVSLACLSCHDGTQAMDVVLNQPGSGGYNPAGAQIDSGAIVAMTGTPVPNLGEDLSNDHPISMQYGGGGASDGDTDGVFAGTLGDPDFNDPVKATINSQAIWWVDSGVGTAQVREKTDMLLYTRSDAIGGGGAVEPFVECGSCHDPHNSDNAGGTQVSFLRTSNAASAVCTACHTK
jgi:predicted CXXCH cytochrome family protein